ncbi:MBL fold metallo-hydrolase [Flavitalea antarctica]
MTDLTLDRAGSAYQSGSLIHETTKGSATIKIGHIDIVLLSHDQHFDNLDHAGKLLLEKVFKTYTTIPGAHRLKGTAIGLKPWQSDIVTAPDGTQIVITATHACHGPAGTEALQGEVVGFVLSVGHDQQLNIYITGDTTHYEGVAEVSKRYRSQYVFLFAGGAQVRAPFNVTMSTNDAIDTAIAFPNTMVITLHYEGWQHYTQNKKDIDAPFKILGISQRLRVLEAGIIEVLR